MNAVSPELDRRFRDAAAAEGLLDAAFDFVDSPVGPLLVATSARGLCRISYDADPERELEQLARDFGVRVLRSAKPIDPARRELDEYFEGKGTPSTFRSTSPGSRTSTAACFGSWRACRTGRSSPTASWPHARRGRAQRAPSARS